jgi:hypothetical protein
MSTVKLLHSFLGATNYLRQNIRHYTDHLTSDLYSALSTDDGTNRKRSPNEKIIWTHELRKSFATLQQAIATAPLINFADHTRPFAIATDALRSGKGSVLFQPRFDGELPTADNIVSFNSSSLKRHERGYSAYKLEFLAIITATRRYHDFVWGRHFTLYTDHQALTNIWTQPHFNNTYAGWILELSDLSFDIKHIPGDTNIVPDILSRLYEDQKWGINTQGPPAIPCPDLPTHAASHKHASFLPTHVNILEPIATSDSDDNIGKLPQSSLQRPPLNPDAQPFNPTTTTGILGIISTTATAATTNIPHASPHPTIATTTTETPKVIPDATAEQLSHIDRVHSIGHFGIQSVYTRLKSEGKNWPYMLHHIRIAVSSCHQCQQWSIVKRGYQPLRSPNAWWPFDIVQFDLATSVPTSSQGNTVLLILVDVLTGFTLLRPLRNKRPTTIANCLLSIFADFGTPRILHSDNEATLVSSILTEFYSTLATHFQTSTPYSPRSLGKAERAVGVALQCIRKLLSSSGGEWDTMAPFAQLSMNNKIKDLTGSDPFSLMFNRTCNIFEFKELSTETNLSPNTHAITSLEEWRQHQAKLEPLIFPAIRTRVRAKNTKTNTKFANAHTTAVIDIPVGTVIAFKDVVRSTKEEPPMLSPYTIHSKAQNGSYFVRDQAGGIFHRPVPIEHIRPLYAAKMPDSSSAAYMDYIFDHRLNTTTRRDEYLVKWSGSPVSDASWVDIADIHDYAAVSQFLATRNRIPKSNKKTRTTHIAQALAAHADPDAAADQLLPIDAPNTITTITTDETPFVCSSNSVEANTVITNNTHSQLPIAQPPIVAHARTATRRKPKTATTVTTNTATTEKRSLAPANTETVKQKPTISGRGRTLKPSAKQR